MLIRLAQPEDALAVARVHVRSWQAAYRSLLPDEYLDQLRPEDRAAHYDFSHSDPQKPYTQVAESDGAILGFATTAPARDARLRRTGRVARALRCAGKLGTKHRAATRRRSAATARGRGIRRSRVYGCWKEMSAPIASIARTAGFPTARKSATKYGASRSRKSATAAPWRRTLQFLIPSQRSNSIYSATKQLRFAEHASEEGAGPRSSAGCPRARLLPTIEESHEL